jgi:hypothetical protein
MKSAAPDEIIKLARLPYLYPFHKDVARFKFYYEEFHIASLLHCDDPDESPGRGRAFINDEK